MEAVVAIIAACGSILSAYVATRTYRQVKPSNGDTLSHILERVDDRLFRHVIDMSIHVKPKTRRVQ